FLVSAGMNPHPDPLPALAGRGNKEVGSGSMIVNFGGRPSLFAKTAATEISTIDGMHRRAVPHRPT
ncbi:MAG TPA: hypothetical protein VGN61_16045, partial [Verrucomicrobiae bacterium]